MWSDMDTIRPDGLLEKRMQGSCSSSGDELGLGLSGQIYDELSA